MPVKPPIFRPAGHVSYNEARASASDRSYDKAWAKASFGFKRSSPLCLGCQAVGRVTQTAVTDHIIPHKGDRSLFVDPGNWQPACRPHHDVVKQRIELLFAQGKATVADLRLDSEMAKALTLDLLG